MANITWSTTNKAATITLTNGNLTATNGIGANAGVMGTSGQASGKYYWEVTLADTPSVNTRVGAAQNYKTATYGGAAYINANATTVDYNINSVTLASPAVTLGAGSVLCFALDFDNKMIWFRVGTGNWNNSGTADPATNTGGYSLAALLTGAAQGISLLPFLMLSGSNHAATANFGDTAFSSAVPSGFTAGIPDNGVNNALVTQEAAEVWSASYPANAQFTQIAVEVWRSVEDVIPPPSTGGVMVMMLS